MLLILARIPFSKRHIQRIYINLHPKAIRKNIATKLPGIINAKHTPPILPVKNRLHMLPSQLLKDHRASQPNREQLNRSIHRGGDNVLRVLYLYNAGDQAVMMPGEGQLACVGHLGAALVGDG